MRVGAACQSAGFLLTGERPIDLREADVAADRERAAGTDRDGRATLDQTECGVWTFDTNGAFGVPAGMMAAWVFVGAPDGDQLLGVAQALVVPSQVREVRTVTSCVGSLPSNVALAVMVAVTVSR